MLLTWRPGQFGRWHVTEPGEVDAQRLVRVAGRVLGPGCVMSDCYDPGRDRPDDWDGQAGLILVDADADADAPGDPAAWLVIERLASCQCEGLRQPDPRPSRASRRDQRECVTTVRLLCVGSTRRVPAVIRMVFEGCTVMRGER
ncbi:hypothetical protein F7R91_28840 [Streptomyces luteolifulvus]|uniref:Uncharacterized protein n=1 Tax=Streptomyces luteolifulvus TaxID=2615112 RepID=A0A6H9UUN7_9ACTN|nr:hypothetical protein [Streptomyces luteolifulvus]KAB1142518.1 hypothetical protein F7R91_28840 [Streptomyces luteolifulvus]